MKRIHKTLFSMLWLMVLAEPSLAHLSDEIRDDLGVSKQIFSGVSLSFIQQALGGSWSGHPEPIDFQRILVDINKRIAKVWNPRSFTQKDRPVVVQFDISHDGIITNIQIQKSSGNETTDRLVVESLNKISPVRTLEEGLFQVSPILGIAYRKSTTASKSSTVFLGNICD